MKLYLYGRSDRDIWYDGICRWNVICDLYCPLFFHTHCANYFSILIFREVCTRIWRWLWSRKKKCVKIHIYIDRPLFFPFLLPCLQCAYQRRGPKHPPLTHIFILEAISCYTTYSAACRLLIADCWLLTQKQHVFLGFFWGFFFDRHGVVRASIWAGSNAIIDQHVHVYLRQTNNLYPLVFVKIHIYIFNVTMNCLLF